VTVGSSGFFIITINFHKDSQVVTYGQIFVTNGQDTISGGC
jgi:hypothetical protein